MSRFQEMTYEEISQKLGISINTVKYHIKSALVVLKKELGTFLCIIFCFLSYPPIIKNCSIYKGTIFMNEQSLHTDTVNDWIIGYLTNSLTQKKCSCCRIG